MTPMQNVAVLYGAMSLVTFLVYAMDKSAARRGAGRTSETTLHLLALVGGWPGALLAQQWLRHKSCRRFSMRHRRRIRSPSAVQLYC